MGEQWAAILIHLGGGEGIAPRDLPHYGRPCLKIKYVRIVKFAYNFYYNKTKFVDMI